ncbi:MAG: outer membrane beta-barrel protein [Pseudomonadota bacterium]
MIAPTGGIASSSNGFTVDLVGGMRADDNVRRQEDGPGDLSFVLQPSLKYQHSFGDLRGSLSYEGGYESYTDLNAENVLNHSIKGDADYRFSKRFRSNLKLGYDVSSESRDDLTGRDTGNAAPDQLVRRSVRLKSVYGRRIAKAELHAEVGHSASRYQNNAQQGRDIDQYDVNLLAYYNFTARFSTVLELRRTYLDYRGGAALDGTNTTLLAGLRWDATARTSGEFKVGRQQRQFYDSAGGQNSIGESWDVNVLWEPRSFSKVRLNTSREVQEAGTAGVGTLVNSSYRASWTHGLTEDLTLTAEAQFDRTRLGGRKDDRMRLSSALAYKISENVQVSAEYARTVSESTQLGSEFENNVIFLQFRAKYSDLK